MLAVGAARGAARGHGAETTLIRSGVTTPKQGAAVMPAYGGTPLEPEQLQAVAAYVYSLSHPLGG
jgi:mono/diheme cytochrome c family protein